MYIRVKLKNIMILYCWRGKFQTGENHVRQGLSKVVVFFTYSKNLTEICRICLQICRQCNKIKSKLMRRVKYLLWLKLLNKVHGSQIEVNFLQYNYCSIFLQYFCAISMSNSRHDHHRIIGKDSIFASFLYSFLQW